MWAYISKKSNPVDPAGQPLEEALKISWKHNPIDPAGQPLEEARELVHPGAGLVREGRAVDLAYSSMELLDAQGLVLDLRPVVIDIVPARIPEALAEVYPKVRAALDGLEDPVELGLGVGVLEALLHARDGPDRLGG